MLEGFRVEEDVMRVNTMLLECVRIVNALETPEEVKDVLLSINALAVNVSMRVQDLLAQTQQCPGPYWRRDEAFQARVAANNANKKRKTKPKTQCRGTKKGVAFDKGGQGPPRADDGVRRLCNLCYQTFVRDQGAGLLK